MKYQLVIQFPAVSAKEFDPLIEIEENLRANITGSAQVDGHDFGSGAFNIFVLTDDPDSTFDDLKSIMAEPLFRYEMRVAYRPLSGEKYTVLWPPTLNEFTVA